MGRKRPRFESDGGTAPADCRWSVAARGGVRAGARPVRIRSLMGQAPLAGQEALALGRGQRLRLAAVGGVSAGVSAGESGRGCLRRHAEAGRAAHLLGPGPLGGGLGSALVMGDGWGLGLRLSKVVRAAPSRASTSR